MKHLFQWTAAEVELLLETVKTYAADCMFEGKDWERVKSKYDKTLALYVERYPRETSEDFYLSVFKPSNNSQCIPFKQWKTSAPTSELWHGFSQMEAMV